MRYIRPHAAALAALLIAAARVEAQDISVVAPGDLARVEILAVSTSPPSAQWMTGRVERAGSDTLWLRAGEARALMPFPSTGYGRLQLRVPRTAGEGAGRGLWMGALIGGGVLAVLATPISGGDENLAAGSLTGLGALAGAVLGAPIGAIIGGLKPGGRWVSARLPEAAPAQN